MEVERYLSPFVEDACQDAALIQDMQELIKQKQYTAAAMYALNYASHNKQIAVVNVEGIQKSESDFDFVTFGFSETGIIKITYNEDDIPSPGQKVSIADFERFCQERYNEDVVFLQTEYAPLVEKYRKTHPAEKRTKEELAKELAEHHATWRSPLIKPQKMDELVQSVRAFLETEVQNKSTQEPNTEQEREDT